MANFELKLPKMGESVAEATITSWLKDIGDTIEADEAVLEIATDKVDSEVPSEVDGVLVEKLFDVDDVVQVGQTLAIIKIEGDDTEEAEAPVSEPAENEAYKAVAEVAQTVVAAKTSVEPIIASGDRFYSPLVKNIAKQEGISQSELDTIPGTGKDGRVTKNDIKSYLQSRSSAAVSTPKPEPVEVKETIAPKTVETKTEPPKPKEKPAPVPVVASGEDEIIEMTRMGKLISKHMIDSVQTSAHVQSFIEADVTGIWNWRNKHKNAFKQREGENLTFTPIFMEAVAKALRDYPMMNISVQGDKIIKKKHINLGMAAALADGNLIVPVIKDADQLNLLGMAKKVNDLANRAR
ncbi:dihydrolipoamide acetyltransferase family protein, partial [Winogradskyella sp.]|uniref:dihydrolipoamide acetyltransferase family protein n=1 Tax=Winogradskyella sp. TaxID=1883156 RepID=UPI00260D84EA